MIFKIRGDACEGKIRDKGENNEVSELTIIADSSSMDLSVK